MYKPVGTQLEAPYDDTEDPEQAEARAFFGGGGAKAASEIKTTHHKF